MAKTDKITLGVGVALLLTTVLYALSLDKIPVHLNQDELGFVINGYSIAQTGYDENGRFFPLYFWHLGVMWSTPIIVYLTALFLKFLPVSESVIRLPSVLIGITDIILIYFIAKKLFKRRLWATVTAGLLALTPAHIIHSRVLLDNLYPVPFVLGWFLCILEYKEKKKQGILLLSACLLGIGTHSYHAAKIIMPLYVIFTYAICYREILKQKILAILILVAFLLPILPLIPWLQQYPDTLTDQVKYTNLYDTNLSPLQGLLTLLTPETISERAAIYVSFYNPEFLFFLGDSSLIHSTQKTGVFLLPLLILICFGLVKAFETKRWWSFLIILGFFTAPIPPALVGNQYRISKALVMLPFAVLLSTMALQYLVSSKTIIKKYTAYALLLAVLIQGIYFIYDYTTAYRNRSYTWYNYDIPGALESVVAESQKSSPSMIVLDNQIWFIERYWQFILLKHHKLDLAGKTLFADSNSYTIQHLPANALVLYRFDHQSPMVTNLQQVKTIHEPDGTSSFYLYKKQ